MLMRRIVANFIDFIILLASTAAGIYFAGLIGDQFEEPFFLLTLSLVCVIILVPIGIQSLFWLTGTTIGKMMTFCVVVDEKGKRLSYMTMFVREHLSKILSCYIVCLPVLVGKPGLHEVVSYSHVELTYKKKNKS